MLFTSLRSSAGLHRCTSDYQDVLAQTSLALWPLWACSIFFDTLYENDRSSAVHVHDMVQC